MDNVILYKTPTCQMCQLLIREMKEKNINYSIIDDAKTLEEKNIISVPVLEVGDKRLNFKQALSWIREENHD